MQNSVDIFDNETHCNFIQFDLINRVFNYYCKLQNYSELIVTNLNNKVYRLTHFSSFFGTVTMQNFTFIPEHWRSQHRIPERPVGQIKDGHRLSGACPLRRNSGREHSVRRQHEEGLDGRGRWGRQASQYTFVHRVFADGKFVRNNASRLANLIKTLRFKIVTLESC